MKNIPAIAKTILLGLIAMTLFLLPTAKLPYLDQKADTYFTNAISNAGIAYASLPGR